ncbi:DUF6115 domain-containing protein [Virgibacillus halophilus]
MGVPFLLVISFLLHIVSLAAIYFLFKQLTAKQEKNKQLPEDFLELMDTYLEEIRFENDKLKQHLEKHTPRTLPQKENTQETASERQTNEHSMDAIAGLSQAKDQTEMSTEAKILQLHQQGKQTEEIAKELGCGKTEAELVIKFHAK